MQKLTAKVVAVEWTDACSGAGGWEPFEKTRTIKPASCTSVGFLLEDRPTHVTIVQSIHWAVKDNAENICIPRKMIKKIRRLGTLREWE